MIDKLTSYQLTQIISDAEKRLIAAKVEQQRLTPQVKDYKASYERLREQLDEIERAISEDQGLLDFATREKNGISEGSKFKLIRGTSHNDMKEKEKRKLEGKKKIIKYRFKWTPLAIQELTNHGHWMRTEELWNRIVQKYEVRKIAEEHGLYMSKLKYACIRTCWRDNDKYTRSGSDCGKLLIIGDKIGLKEWADSNFKVIAV